MTLPSSGPSGEFVAAQLEPLPGFPRAAEIQTVDSSENQPVTPLLGTHAYTHTHTHTHTLAVVQITLVCGTV